MHRTLATPLVLMLAVALCLLLPGAALAGKNKGKKAKKKGRPPIETVVEEREQPGNGLGPGGVPALRDDLRSLAGELRQLRHDFDEANEATRNALARIANTLHDLEAADDAILAALEHSAAALQSLDARVSSLEELARDDDLDGFSENLGDCDDANPDVHPMMFEVPGNDIDDDCDFEIDEPEGEPTPLEP